MWPATVLASSDPPPVAARDDLLREAVDEVRAVHVPADVETDEGDPAAPLDRDDLAEQDRGILGQRVAGLRLTVTPRPPSCRAMTAA